MKTTLKLSAAVLALCSGLETAPLFGSDWTLTDLGTLGGSESFASSINDLGQVVGMSRLAGDGETHAFFYANGAMTDLSPINSGSIQTAGLGLNNLGQIASGFMAGGIYYPALFDVQSGHTTTLGSLGGVTSYGFSGVATAVNDAGMAVGYSYLDSVNSHAFIYRNGALTDLGSFGGYSGAMAVNSAGVVAGFASDAYSGSSRASLWINNSILDISFGRESEAYGINDLGQVVGDALTEAGNRDHAFLFSNGASQDLGALKNGRNSYAFSINNHGEVVGTADAFFNLSFFTNPATGEVIVTTNYHNHAFLYRDGAMVDLNSLISTNSGWELSWASGVNNSGQIVGYGSVDGHTRSFVLTEVPEPGTPLLVIATLAGIFACRSRAWRLRTRPGRDYSTSILHGCSSSVTRKKKTSTRASSNESAINWQCLCPTYSPAKQVGGSLATRPNVSGHSCGPGKGDVQHL